MPKMIAVLKRKPGMSFEEFRTYYETRHVPLVKRIMGDNLEAYIRNYVDQGSPFPVGVPVDFDCISEFHYLDQQRFEAAVAAIQHPSNVDRVRADELNFLDIDAARLCMADVRTRTDGAGSSGRGLP
jgi:uncharacterized protein (TIGR02118 family)